MSKKKNKKQARVWRTFNIDMPEAMIPLYDFLQKELNRVLSDEHLMTKVRNVDLDLHKGNYWREMAKAIASTFSDWDIGANAWYQRMLYENIRRIMESGRERRIVHDMLVKHENNICDEFWKDLHEIKCYPKYGVVRNVKREIDNGDFTDVPTSAGFVMDYSNVSDKAIKRDISERRWLFRTGKSSWIDIEIFLPKNIRKQATGKIAKPRFVKRASDTRYVGCVSYEISVDEYTDTGKIFGVDLGLIKPFSGSALGIDGQVSSEYIISKRTQHLIDKYERICETLDKLLDKQQRCTKLNHGEKYARREEEIGHLRSKKRNLRTEIVRFVALDIVMGALAEDCGEIHIENLSWLESTGGHWNHSEIQVALSDIAAIYGLRVYRVNAAHSSDQSPFNEELGVARGRDVVFEDGWIIDRDFLSSVNLARRSVSKDKKLREVDPDLKSQKKHNTQRVRRSRRACLGSNESCNSREELNYSKVLSGGTDVVVFSAGVAGLPAARSIVVMADTENMALINDDLNKCLQQSTHLKEKSTLLI